MCTQIKIQVGKRNVKHNGKLKGNETERIMNSDKWTKFQQNAHQFIYN